MIDVRAMLVWTISLDALSKHCLYSKGELLLEFININGVHDACGNILHALLAPYFSKLVCTS